jgi:hypothetical protein
MRYETAGKSLMAFGAVLIVGSIVASFFLDAFMVDFLTVVVIGLGGAVKRGSTRATRWSIAIMAFYLAVAALAAVSASLGIGQLRLGGRPVRPADLLWVITLSGVITVWVVFNLFLLVRALRSSKQVA